MPSPEHKIDYVSEGLARLTSEFQKERVVNNLLTEDGDILVTENGNDLIIET